MGARRRSYLRAHDLHRHAVDVERFCGGRRATIVETARRDLLRGTRRADVIATLGGNDRVDGLRGNDVVCGGRTGIASWAAAAETHWSAAPGCDTCLGGRGRDHISCP